MGCHSLLQGIFPTQELNPGLLHCRQILYQLNYEGSLLPQVATMWLAATIMDSAILEQLHQNYPWPGSDWIHVGFFHLLVSVNFVILSCKVMSISLQPGGL